MKLQDGRRAFLFCFMAGFMAGILYANVLAGEYLLNMGILDSYFLESYEKSEMDMRGYLCYLLYLRVPPVVVLGMTAATKFRKAAALGFVLWTGFSGGLILTAAVMKMGVRGIALCLAGILPQAFFYVAAYLMFLWFLYFYPQVKWNLSKTVCFVLFLIVGILLEGYVNPAVMRIFLQTF